MLCLAFDGLPIWPWLEWLRRWIYAIKNWSLSVLKKFVCLIPSICRSLISSVYLGRWMRACMGSLVLWHSGTASLSGKFTWRTLSFCSLIAGKTLMLSRTQQTLAALTLKIYYTLSRRIEPAKPQLEAMSSTSNSFYFLDVRAPSRSEPRDPRALEKQTEDCTDRLLRMASRRSVCVICQTSSLVAKARKLFVFLK